MDNGWLSCLEKKKKESWLCYRLKNKNKNRKLKLKIEKWLGSDLILSLNLCSSKRINYYSWSLCGWLNPKWNLSENNDQESNT